MPALVPSKLCATCGRCFAWRKKWERSWDDVRYCSKACKRGLTECDAQLEAAMVRLLGAQARRATICPSEAAKAVEPERTGHEDDWRELMEPARRAARRLVTSGTVVITQKGAVVDPSTAKGPFRIRKAS